MSRQLLCVIKDTKGGFLTPMPYMNKAHCYRNAELMLRKAADTPLGQFPGDYEMWYIGEWDPVQGELFVLQDKEFLFNFVDLTKKGGEQ